MTDEEIKELKKALTPTPKETTTNHYLSTGSTLINLACADRYSGGFAAGKYYFLVGDSTSGKTFLSLTCFAEAMLDPYFKDYNLIFDDPEDGALMDKTKFFGKKVAEKLSAPKYNKGEPVFSNTVEDFYDSVESALDTGIPFIYVLDSMDALDTEADNKYIEKKKKQDKEESSGSYGTSKAKLNSSRMRRIIPRLRESGSILIVIGQTKDNFGPGAVFNPKRRSGGHALRFYATIEIWTSVKETVKVNIKGKRRQLGIICKAQVKKNRTSGYLPSVEVPIYHSTGIDDIGSCVDYLVEEKHWKATNGKIEATELAVSFGKEKLISYIEENNLELKLRKIVAKVWKEIKLSCEVKRKRRYD